MEESRFINECQHMSFEQLGTYIETCFSHLKQNKPTKENFPKDEKTYSALIGLLEDTFLGNLRQLRERKKEISEVLIILKENVSDELTKQIIER